MKYSPWFPSKVKPIHHGVYQRDIPGIGIRFSFWTGKYWGGFATNYEHAIDNQGFRTGHPRGTWRGLARKPK